MVTHFLGLRMQGSSVLLPATHRRRILSVLTNIQNASAGAIAAFSVVHLSAPLMGLLHLSGDVNDRVDAVSRWMLLGRVAYQSGLGEALLWASLGAHVVSGVVKRLVTCFTSSTAVVEPTTEDEHGMEAEKAAASRIKLNVAQKSGYILIPFALHHSFVNRIIPSRLQPPISELSPSELDYSIVAHSLSHPNAPVKWVMAGVYVMLIRAFAVHYVNALPALLRGMPKQKKAGSSSRGKTSRKIPRAHVAASIATVLLTSLLSIVPLRSTDRLTISSALKGRYDAVLRVALPTRLFF